MRVILATTSRHRIRGFESLRIPFEDKSSEVDESLFLRESPDELVQALSREKAESVARRCSEENFLVLGFDSVGYFDGKILEKPKSRREAFYRLEELSNEEHWFITGVHVLVHRGGKNQSNRFWVEKTKVKLRELSEKEVGEYLDLDSEYISCALGYNPRKGLSSSFVEKVEGDLSNLLYGFPFLRVKQMVERGCKNEY